MSKSKILTVYGGCYDGRNRVFVAAPTKKSAYEAVSSCFPGLSYYGWNAFTSDSGNEYEISIAVPHPLCVYQRSVNERENAKMIGHPAVHDAS